MYKICIRALEVFAHHGVFAEEQALGQKFIISAEIELDAQTLIHSLEQSEDYSKIVDVMEKTARDTRYELLEELADRICVELLINFGHAASARVTVSKASAPLPQSVDSVEVEAYRRWTTVAISAGSNLGDSENYLNTARDSIQKSPMIRNLSSSSYRCTKPVGKLDQPDFLNCAFVCDTLFTPHELLSFLADIENSNGRVRVEKWGPRTLDLDIVLFGDKEIFDKNLIIPHPLALSREFVITPLTEIAPQLVLLLNKLGGKA